MSYILPALSFGILLGIFYYWFYAGANLILLVVVFILSVIGLFVYNSKKSVIPIFKNSLILFTCFVLLGVAIGAKVAQSDEMIISYKENYYKHKSSLTIDTNKFYKIVTDISYRDSSQIFVVEQIDGGSSLNYKILVTSNLANRFEFGDIVKLSGVAKEGEVIYADPAQSKNGFDYREYLYKSRVDYFLSYTSVAHAESADYSLSFYEKLKRNLYKVKWQLVNNLESSMSSPESGLAAGMLFGVEGLMGKDVEQDMRNSGLSHITVLSGYNLMIVIISIFYILKYLPWRFRIFSTLICVLIFVTMVGGGPSLWRALIMTVASMVGMIGFRMISPKITLWYAFIFIALFYTYGVVKDIGLHLSMLATIGLVYGIKPLSFCFNKVQFLKRHEVITEVMSASLSVYLVITPYILYVFGSASFLSVFYNLLVGILTGPIMLLSFITSTIYFLSPLLGVIFGFLDYILLHMILLISELAHTDAVGGLISVKSYIDIDILFVFFVYVFYILLYFLMLTLMKRK